MLFTYKAGVDLSILMEGEKSVSIRHDCGIIHVNAYDIYDADRKVCKVAEAKALETHTGAEVWSTYAHVLNDRDRHTVANMSGEEFYYYMRDDCKDW